MRNPCYFSVFESADDNEFSVYFPDLRENLLTSETKRLDGEKTYTIKEVSERLNNLLNELSN